MSKKQFNVVVREERGKQVIPVDRDDEDDQKLIKDLCGAAQSAVDDSKKNPIRSERINEVGNKVESYVAEAINALAGYEATVPINRLGKKQSSGYPDLLVIDPANRPSYLECKTYSAETKGSSYRSFYFSSGKNSKVTRDARHLLLAFQMSENNNSYKAERYKLLDLYSLPCQLKREWNSNNRELYAIPVLGESG